MHASLVVTTVPVSPVFEMFVFSIFVDVGDLVVVDFVIPDFLVRINLLEVNFEDDDAEPVGNPPGHELFVGNLLGEGVGGNYSLNKDLFPEWESEEEVDESGSDLENGSGDEFDSEESSDVDVGVETENIDVLTVLGVLEHILEESSLPLTDLLVWVVSHLFVELRVVGETGDWFPDEFEEGTSSFGWVEVDVVEMFEVGSVFWDFLNVAVDVFLGEGLGFESGLHREVDGGWVVERFFVLGVEPDIDFSVLFEEFVGLNF